MSLSAEEVRQALTRRGADRGAFRGALSRAERQMLDRAPQDDHGPWELCGYKFPASGNRDEHSAHHDHVWARGPIDWDQCVERLPATWLARQRADGTCEAICGEHSHLTAGTPTALYLAFTERCTPWKLPATREHVADMSVPAPSISA